MVDTTLSLIVVFLTVYSYCLLYCMLLWHYNVISHESQSCLLDANVEGDAVEGSVGCVSRDQVAQVLNEMKIGKDSG